MFTLLPGDDERDEGGDLNDGGGDGGGGIAMSSSLSSSPDDINADTAGGGGGGGGGSGVGHDGDQEEEMDADEGEVMCWIPCGRVLWRVLPDALSILLLICLSPLITDKEMQGWLWFVAIPFLFLAIVTLSMSQQGLDRINPTRYLILIFLEPFLCIFLEPFCGRSPDYHYLLTYLLTSFPTNDSLSTRFFLESWLMTAMGYASYPLYLFQRIIFTFYLPLLYIGTLTHHYDMYIGNENPWQGGPWFEQLPLLVKILCVAMLTGKCWKDYGD